MIKDALSVTAGIAVLIAGALVVLNLTSAPDPSPVSEPPAPAAATTTIDEMRLPDLPGVSQEIQRVLYWKGSAEAVTAVQLTEIPSPVVKVLIEYGVPLRVPTSDDEGAT